MRRIRTSFVLAALLALGATGWILSGQLGGEIEAPALAAQEPAAGPTPDPAAPVPVRVATLHAKPWREAIVVRGHTAASRQVKLRAETEGTVEALPVARGRQVKAGELLLQLAADDRPSKLRMAQALLKQREIEYKASKSLSVKGFRAETSLAQAEAVLEAARAELARIEIDIANTKVRAPFDGVLNTRPMELGDFVSVGDEVATVVDLDPIYVVGYVSERKVGHLKPGDAGTARLTDGRMLRGTIHYVAATAEAATRTFRVELEVPNPDGALVDGITAELAIDQGATHAHLVSPAILSLSDAGIIGIKAVGADNVVQFHPVDILGDGPEGIWLGGLDETITVITVGHEFVQPGHVVTPVRVADGARETADGAAQ